MSFEELLREGHESLKGEKVAPQYSRIELLATGMLKSCLFVETREDLQSQLELMWEAFLAKPLVNFEILVNVLNLDNVLNFSDMASARTDAERQMKQTSSLTRSKDQWDLIKVFKHHCKHDLSTAQQHHFLINVFMRIDEFAETNKDENYSQDTLLEIAGFRAYWALQQVDVKRLKLNPGGIYKMEEGFNFDNSYNPDFNKLCKRGAAYREVNYRGYVIGTKGY